MPPYEDRATFARCTKILVKFSLVVFELWERTDIQTNMLITVFRTYPEGEVNIPDEVRTSNVWFLRCAWSRTDGQSHTHDNTPLLYRGRIITGQTANHDTREMVISWFKAGCVLFCLFVCLQQESLAPASMARDDPPASSTAAAMRGKVG